MSKINLMLAGFAFAFCQPAEADGLLSVVNPVDRVLSSKNGGMIFSGQYFEASDYTSMRHFSDDWRGSYTPRDGKNLAISFGRADVSVQHESWSAGYFYRHDVLVESNKDMTDIVHANKTGAPVSAGRQFDASLATSGFEAQGIRLDKAFAWKTENMLNVTFGIGASLMNGQRTRMGQTQGSALSTATGYTYNANLSEADSQKTYPFMPPGDVASVGYALDFGLCLQWQDGKRLDIAVNDLAGEIRWKNLPQTTMIANSVTATHDSQGYIMFNPSMSGQNSRAAITQKLDTKGSVQFHAPLGDGVSANLETDWISNNVFPRFGFEYVTARWIGVMADYDIRFGTLGMGATWKNSYLFARTQSMNLEQSRGYGFGAGWVYRF